MLHTHAMWSNVSAALHGHVQPGAFMRIFFSGAHAQKGEAVHPRKISWVVAEKNVRWQARDGQAHLQSPSDELRRGTRDTGRLRACVVGVVHCAWRARLVRAPVPTCNFAESCNVRVKAVNLLAIASTAYLVSCTHVSLRLGNAPNSRESANSASLRNRAPPSSFRDARRRLAVAARARGPALLCRTGFQQGHEALRRFAPMRRGRRARVHPLRCGKGSGAQWAHGALRRIRARSG